MANRIGVFRHRVKLEEATEVTTSTGVEKTWNFVCWIWCAISVIDKRGSAKYQKAGVSDVSYNVTLRSPVKLAIGKNRFVWGDKLLEVKIPPVNMDTVKKEILVSCSLQGVQA